MIIFVIQKLLLPLHRFRKVTTEGWVSGLNQQFAKLSYGILYRGFESPSFRIKRACFFSTLFFSLHFIFFKFYFKVVFFLIYLFLSGNLLFSFFKYDFQIIPHLPINSFIANDFFTIPNMLNHTLQIYFFFKILRISSFCEIILPRRTP